VADRRYPILLALNLVAAAHCMVAQMALAVTLSFVAGHSITVFAIFVGLYLAAMGVGVLVVERLDTSTSGWLNRLLLLLTAAVFAACPGVPALMLAYESAGGAVVWILGVALSLVLGGVAGAFLPVVSRVAEAEGWPAARPLIAALTSEYAGAFLGCMTFALLLYPHLGLVRAVVVSQAVAIIAINLAAVGLGLARQRPGRVLLAMLLLDGWLAASFTFQDQFVVFLDQLPM